METMSSMRAQLPSDAADLPPGAMPRDPSDRWSAAVTPPRGVYKLKDDATGYVMTKPFEANNPMPGAFRETCDYIVPMLNPVLKPKGQGVKKAPTEAGAEASTSGKAKKEKKPAAVVEDVDPILKSKLAVGVVVDVGYVENSDKLYLCKVDVGEEAPRQVVTGLRAYVPEDVLKGAKVLTILNLKPAKLAGQTSEAMILATEFDGQVKLVGVPADAKAGDAVGAAGFTAPETYPKECKSKFWASVQEKLSVKGGKAYYGDAVLACASGECTADAPDGSGIK